MCRSGGQECLTLVLTHLKSFILSSENKIEDQIQFNVLLSRHVSDSNYLPCYSVTIASTSDTLYTRHKGHKINKHYRTISIYYMCTDIYCIVISINTNKNEHITFMIIVLVMS